MHRKIDMLQKHQTTVINVIIHFPVKKKKKKASKSNLNLN